MSFAREPKTRDGTYPPGGAPIINNQSSLINPSGFTLIELLVVISIIALLMAILLPTLQRVRKQAKAVACQAKLRQWGVAFTMYTAEHDGKLFIRYAVGEWPMQMASYYRDTNDLLLCPMAPVREYTSPVSYTMADGLVARFQRFGGTFASWQQPYWRHPLDDITKPACLFHGSYGLNFDALGFFGENSFFGGPRAARQPGEFPLLLDCAWMYGLVSPKDAPPMCESTFSQFDDHGMGVFCINRHQAGINALFLDSSVRKVGLKELWMLQWSPFFNQAGPWTRAGGVRPEDWPAWMRSFKDY